MYVWVPEVGNTADIPNPPQVLPLFTYIENYNLDFYSHHDKRHRISAAETLLHRATNLPNTKQGKETELTQVTDALRFNNYPQNVISNILKKKSSTQRTNSVPTPEELGVIVVKR